MSFNIYKLEEYKGDDDYCPMSNEEEKIVKDKLKEGLFVKCIRMGDVIRVFALMIIIS